MNKLIAPLFALILAAASAAHAQQQETPATPTPLDGDWSGRSNGGSCNAPLDFALTIEGGIVDGTAYDTTARGPVPNLHKGAPPPPTPGLWQIHGLAKGANFSLLTVASVQGGNRRSGKLTVTVQGNALSIAESGGCGRSAQLARN
jgi:hypothetical protein